MSPSYGLLVTLVTSDVHVQAFMSEAGEQGVLLASLGTIAELSKPLTGPESACIQDTQIPCCLSVLASPPEGVQACYCQRVR